MVTLPSKRNRESGVGSRESGVGSRDAVQSKRASYSSPHRSIAPSSHTYHTCHASHLAVYSLMRYT
ncbi:MULTISPECIES: hypothetical protein [unclassified Moorena]|uniref:hypothetical protein n=1 Tax=unclassified Moorena TaxID=2683338 RepID=UPI001400146C|nr:MULTISPECIES: hypothetical protein [unclassified Moorena]NEO16804.1 hypothetical protein [Moorena sp. SIO3E8]NEQ03382.1 hypothetical protein [Moorena sp. SIO3F7]